MVPDGYPYFITSEWDPPYRTARIFQLLRAGKALSVGDMLRIQTDILSLQDKWLAGQLLDAASHVQPRDPDVQYALGVLRGWDGEARMDSAATLVCAVTRAALRDRILKPKLGDGLTGYRWGMSSTFFENVLTNHWTRWLPPGDASFDDTLMKSLEEAVRRIPIMVGSQSHEAWKWGDTIRLTFYHPLGQGIPLLGRLLERRPVFPSRNQHDRESHNSQPRSFYADDRRSCGP